MIQIHFDGTRKEPWIVTTARGEIGHSEKCEAEITADLEAQRSGLEVDEEAA